MKEIITVIVVLIFTENCNCYIHRHNHSIFIYDDIKDYCDMKCGNEPHTLCRQKDAEPPPLCAENFRLYKETEIEDDLLMGFNGLRDRIADKMQVANMVMLSWDEELSLMAEIFLGRCKPFEKNPCANMGKAEEGAQENEPRYYHIADNMKYRKNRFLPYDFVPSIFRDWYYEKNYLDPPRIYESEYEELYGIILGHNNFTRLANPRLSRMGCSLARFHDGFTLLCYFFPYFQTNVRFARGRPTTNCPNMFPLKGAMFPNLCTNKGVRSDLAIKLLFIYIFASLYCENTYGYRMFRLRVQGGLIFWQKWNW